MKWQVILEKMHQIETKEGSEPDPLSILAAKVAARGGSVSRINMSVKYSLEYGAPACSASVTIDCPQTEAFMDLAAEVAFTKAHEYANDGFSHLISESQG